MSEEEKDYLYPEQPWVIEDRFVCFATHPDKPDWTGNARSRKYHLSGTGVKTICNMLIAGLVVGVFQDSTREFCKVCKP